MNFKHNAIILTIASLSLFVQFGYSADSSRVTNFLKPIQIRIDYQHLEGTGFFPKHLFIDDVSRRDLSAIELSYQKPLIRFFSLNMFSKTAAQKKFSIGAGGRLFQERSKNEFTSTQSLMLVSYIFPDLYVRSITEIQESATNANATIVGNDGRVVSLSEYSSMKAKFSRYEIGLNFEVKNEAYHTVDVAYFQTSMTKPMILPNEDSILYLSKIDQKGLLFRYYHGPEWFTFSAVLGWGWPKIMLTNDLRLDYIDKDGEKSRYFDQGELDFAIGLDFYVFRYIRVRPRTGWLAYGISTVNEAYPVIDEYISYWYTDVSLTLKFSEN